MAITAIKAYRRFLSPILGPHCRFHPTCSQYALDAFRTHGFIKGTVLTTMRIARCGPWHPGGIDHVPEEFHLFKKYWGR
ncbi:MAG: membrane protein insertion efficiency factor YidD [Synergistaceae bacterium]|nr:membrane protein insertion efficiency factor YidD [Synergistaceae bacterium]